MRIISLLHSEHDSGICSFVTFSKSFNINISFLKNNDYLCDRIEQ